MPEQQPDLTTFALEELSRQGAVLVFGNRVYLRTGRPMSWREVATLASLEDLDSRCASPHSPDLQQVEECRLDNAEAMLLSLLPEAARRYARAILTFCVQAERYRRGKAAGSLLPIFATAAPSRVSRIMVALGTPVALIYHGIVFVPRAPLPGADPSLPTQDEALLPLFQPGGSVTLSKARARYTRVSRPAHTPLPRCQSLEDDVDGALAVVEKTLRTPRQKWGRQLVYECEETGFSVVIHPDGRPLLTLASDPWVVEDADGALYRFDGFVLAVHPAPDPKTRLLAGTPGVIYPPGFQHWRAVSRLHMCTYVPEEKGSSKLHIDNCVSLLLSGRHMLQAGLYGASGSRPVLATKFPHRRISRMEAERLGLPIYPFRRAVPVRKETGRGTSRCRAR